jgi:hypothetical protein
LSSRGLGQIPTEITAMPLEFEPPENGEADPIDNFYLQLELAQSQASEKRFSDAYQTLVSAYENLIEQHEAVTRGPHH